MTPKTRNFIQYNAISSKINIRKRAAFHKYNSSNSSSPKPQYFWRKGNASTMKTLYILISTQATFEH